MATRPVDDLPAAWPDGQGASVVPRPWGAGFLRCTAIAVFTVYCLWWAYWLAHGQLPPALFRAFTGLPAPTTGMTRALTALRAGEWRSSLAYNAMTLPILALAALTIAWLCAQVLRGRRMVMPRAMARTWAVLLATAWLLKLFSAPQYW